MSPEEDGGCLDEFGDREIDFSSSNESGGGPISEAKGLMEERQECEAGSQMN